METPPINTVEDFDTNVMSVLRTLPVPIQEFLTSPERDSVTVRIVGRYNLHVDQSGQFQKAFLFMLMGIFSPEEFVNNLVEAGISEETVRSLANDVNEMVFKPLREKEREENVVASPVPAPQPVVIPAPSLERTPVPYAGARPQPLTPFNLPGADAHPNDLFRTSTRTVTPGPLLQSVQAPVTPPTPIPAPQPIVPAPAQMPPEKLYTPPQPVQAPREEALGGTLRTMATDMLAVNEHREPEPVQYKGTVFTPPVLMETLPKMVPVSPKPSPIPAPVVSRETSVPSSIRPGARPTVTPSPSSELITEYSSDPYREPV